MKTSATFSLLLLTTALAAQSYTFELGQSAYTELTDGTPVNAGEVWDDPDFRVPLGFTFSLFGTPLDTLYFDGWTGSGGDFGNQYVNPDGDGPDGPRHLIFAYINDLADRGSASGAVSLSPITYHLTGTAPNRVGVLQWKNAGFFDDIDEDGVSDHFVNFQFWVYEGSGRMEVHYGPSSPAVREGLQGTNPGFALIKNLVDDQVSGISYEEGYYLKGTVEDPQWVNVDGLGEEDPFLDRYPAAGTVFSFEVAESNGTRDAELLAGHFAVFPNPTSASFRVQLGADFTGRVDQLDIFDTAGRRLAGYAGVPEDINLTDLPPGIYAVRLTTDSGRTTQQRLVKR